jgi:tRNA dimethylallyltransferase
VNKKLIVIVGPTAVGKTAVAIEMAERLKTEIVSADSRQIYKELEIGTAKPTVEELARVKHHFINTKSIEEDYNAGQYGSEAMTVIEKLFESYNNLILCGGSGLYVKALLEGFDEMPKITVEMRQQVIDEYAANGLDWLQAEVKKIDLAYFEEVDEKNPQRLMRALELYRAAGKPMSELRKKERKELPFDVVKIGLELPREELYERIDARMDKMIEHGLFEEAEKFYARKELNALQTVGYREIFGFMKGEYDREEAIRLLKRNSRHYAKRQMTWFKRDEKIRWCRADEVIQNLKF